MALSKIDSSSVNGLGYGFKNRIINGDMRIDQRNAGAAVVAPNSNTYQLDRWCCNVGGAGFTVQQNAGSVTPPTGFKNYYGVTSTSTTAASNYSIRQFIEGFNTADLMYGTADAKTTTLSFWIYSSLTGTFGGAIQNASGNRSYVYSYTINAANTWQYVTVTIPGDTGGTWVGATNGAGIVLYISYSVAAGQTGGTGAWTGNDYRAPTGQVNLLGTNGATWYITGVQLEKGTVATEFDYRPYGAELQLCQRYFEKSWKQDIKVGTTSPSGYQTCVTGTNSLPQSFGFSQVYFKVNKRTTAPTCAVYSFSNATVGVLSNGSNGADLAAGSATLNATSDMGFNFYNNSGTTLTTISYNVIYMWTADAEL